MKRIGILYPSGGFTEEELYKMLPSSVSIHITRIPLKDAKYDTILHMADTVEDAAKLLADIKGLGVIGFDCTAGSFIRGKGYDQEIINRITHATGLPATTKTTAVIEGLKALGIRKMMLITNYTERMTKVEEAFLRDLGFEVLDHAFSGLDDLSKQVEIEPEQWYEMALKLKNPQADGYFLSCGGMRVVSVIEKLENQVGKPVITSNQAFLWQCLRKVGFFEPVQGFGRLMRL